MRRWLFLTSTLLTIALTLGAQAPAAGLDLATIGRIRAEALTRSQAMDNHWWLSEVFGPRATGTPAYTAGADWTMKKLNEWGLENVHTERFPFGQGWTINIIADIPGSDLASEVVIMGAHFDTYPYATGATDNTTGTVAMIEAVRAIQALGLKPRRTIRLALWAAEEQGLLGSRAYVQQHFYDFAANTAKPGHEKLQAYFNLDNGTGRILGIWGQGNLGAIKMFEQWGESVKDLGWKTVSPRTVTATDHGSFDNAGLPGFQFIQERLEYNSRTHHSNMDAFDHVQREDVTQQGAVAAVFAWYAANTTERLPRKSMPPVKGTP